MNVRYGTIVKSRKTGREFVVVGQSNMGPEAPYLKVVPVEDVNSVSYNRSPWKMPESKLEPTGEHYNDRQWPKPSYPTDDWPIQT